MPSYVPSWPGPWWRAACCLRWASTTRGRYNAYCLADDVMEPYRPYVDRLVFGLFREYGPEAELGRGLKARLLSVPVLEVRMEGKRSPLMVAAGQTAASLYKCFSGELRRVCYPEY